MDTEQWSTFWHYFHCQVTSTITRYSAWMWLPFLSEEREISQSTGQKQLLLKVRVLWDLGSGNLPPRNMPVSALPSFVSVWICICITPCAGPPCTRASGLFRIHSDPDKHKVVTVLMKYANLHTAILYSLYKLALNNHSDKLFNMLYVMSFN